MVDGNGGWKVHGIKGGNYSEHEYEDILCLHTPHIQDRPQSGWANDVPLFMLRCPSNHDHHSAEQQERLTIRG